MLAKLKLLRLSECPSDMVFQRLRLVHDHSNTSKYSFLTAQVTSVICNSDSLRGERLSIAT